MWKRFIAASVLATSSLVFAGAQTPANASYFNDMGSMVGEYASCVRAVGIKGPVRCKSAQGHASSASTAAEQNFKSSTLHNGKGDAFRHCYWNARMTLDFGSGDAKKIADNHEKEAPGPAKEESMDKSNNNHGRIVGNYVSGVGGGMARALSMCQYKANNGELVTLK